MRPKLLDLFCGAGGAGEGYRRAGFDVTGVDVKPMPNNPHRFIQAEALAYAESHGREYDAIHASPPCQAYTNLRGLGKQPGDRPKLIEPTRDVLQRLGRPYIIENVIGSPLMATAVLCGQFFGLAVRRHRLFECSFSVFQPDCKPHHTLHPVAVYGDHPERSKHRPGSGGFINRANTLEHGRQAMGIDWMVWRELTQAIPPAYTNYIGKALLNHMGEHQE